MRRLIATLVEALNNDAALILVASLGLLTLTLSVLTLTAN